MSDYNDDNYGGTQGEEWRYGGSGEDAWGAADAQDFYDEGAPYDMSIEEYAAGLEYDPRYERPYMGNYAQPPNPNFQQGNVPTVNSDVPASAQHLRNRFMRRGQQIVERRRGGDGIDGLFDLDFSRLRLGGFGCSPLLILLSAVILILLCVVMGWLAANALMDILSF